MKNNWWKDEVVYQIYPKSFKDSNADGIGDINGIISKLDYLSYLGITMIWLSPIFKSPMVDNGYDVSDYRDIDPIFGTIEDFERLINEAAKYGIKIMLDLVLNHTSDEHPWFKEALSDKNSKYRDYYIFKESVDVPNNWRSLFGGSTWEKLEGEDTYYFHTFHKRQPELNWENEQVRQELYDIVNFWIAKGINAFRLDAINHIKKDPSYPDYPADDIDNTVSVLYGGRNQVGLEDLLYELKDNTFGPNNSMTVGETTGLEYDRYDDFIGKDGILTMVFDFNHTYIDLDTENDWTKKEFWTIKEFKEVLFAGRLSAQQYGWDANFIENHDSPRASSKFLKDFSHDIEAIKTLGAMNFFMRGTPFIYQGQELGMINFDRSSIDDFDDIASINQYYHALNSGISSKEALADINERSRDNSRVPFRWDNSKYAGFSDVKPWIKPLESHREINVLNQIGKESSVLEFYKKMIALRQESAYGDILKEGLFEPIDTNDDVIAYKRILDNKEIHCYFNLGDQIYIEDAVSKNIIFTNKNDTENCFDGSKLILNPFDTVLIEK